MKLREGFVSNSSSSSFVVSHLVLSPLQRVMILHYQEACEWFGMSCSDSDAWSVIDKGYGIVFSTSMDNFDMREFLRKIGVTKIANED